MTDKTNAEHALDAIPLLSAIVNDDRDAIKYYLYESDLEPNLRFLHDTGCKPSSWIQINANHFKSETHQSKTQINISTNYINIKLIT